MEVKKIFWMPVIFLLVAELASSELFVSEWSKKTDELQIRFSEGDGVAYYKHKINENALESPDNSWRRIETTDVSAIDSQKLLAVANPFSGLGLKGNEKILWFHLAAFDSQNRGGLPINYGLKMDFKKPSMSTISPGSGKTRSSLTPLMEIFVDDGGSGIERGSIKLFINGNEKSETFDAAEKKISYQVTQQDSLFKVGDIGHTDGRNTLRIVVDDNLGNRLEKQWEFIINTAYVEPSLVTLFDSSPSIPETPNLIGNDNMFIEFRQPDIKIRFPNDVSVISVRIEKPDGTIVGEIGADGTAIRPGYRRKSFASREIELERSGGDLEDGGYTIIIESSDNSGNSGKRDVHFRIDGSAPQISQFVVSEIFSPEPASPTIQDTATMSFAASEKVDYTLIISRAGSLVKTFTGTSIEATKDKWEAFQDWNGRDSNGNIAADGEYAVTLRVTDGLHQVTFSEPRTIKVDKTNPEIRIDSISPAPARLQIIAAEFTASDANGMAGSCAAAINLRGREEAQAGCLSFSGLSSYSLNIDFNSPQLSAIAQGFEGEAKITIRGRDRAGNPGEGSRTFELDAKPPRVFGQTQFSNGLANSLISANIRDKATSSIKESSIKLFIDNFEDGQEVSLLPLQTGNDDGGSYRIISYRISQGSELEKRTHSARVVVEDIAGNSISEDWSFVVDPNFPDVQPAISVQDANYVDGVAYTKTQNPSITIDFSGTDENIGLAGVSVSGNQLSCSLQTDKIWVCGSSLTEGDYEAVVISHKIFPDGSAGNNAIFRSSIVVDTTPPSLSVELPSIGGSGISKTSEREIELGYSYGDLYMDRIEFRGDISEVTLGRELLTDQGSSTEDVTLTEAEGGKTIEVTAYDLAGNQQQVTKTIELDLDFPSITITGVSPAIEEILEGSKIYKTKESTVAITGEYTKDEGEDIAIYEKGNRNNEVSLKPVSLTSGTFSINVAVNLANSLEKKTLVIVDKARVDVTTEASINVIRDNQGPAITSAEVTKGQCSQNPLGCSVNENLFDLIIGLDEQAQGCSARYAPQQGGNEVTRILTRDIGNARRYVLPSISGLRLDEPVTFSISCSDLSGNEQMNGIDITVDTSAPSITDFGLSNGNLVSESGNRKDYSIVLPPASASITAKTNEETRCRYSTSNQGYSGMPNDFGNLDFKAEHASGDIELEDGKKTTFYISCIDRAEREVAEKAIVSVNVDLSGPVPILDGSLLPAGIIDDPRPVLQAKTAMPASCTVEQKFDGITGVIRNLFSGPIDMISADGLSHKYPDAPADWPGDFTRGKDYKFEVRCTAQNREPSKKEINFYLQLEGEFPGVGGFIRLAKPEFGVASEYTFDIKIETIEEAICRWDVDEGGFGLKTMKEFTSPENIPGKEHTIKDFNKEFEFIQENDESIHKLYVKCDKDSDGTEDETSAFDIRIDKTNPVIDNAYFFPNPAGDPDRTTKLNVKTSEPAICRFGPSQDTSQMEPMGDKFLLRHSKSVTLPGEGEHKYYVFCEDKVNNPSEIKEAIASYDPNLEFSIIKRTKAFFGPDDIPFFTIESNIKAECRYKNASWTEFRNVPALDGGYSHSITFIPGSANSLEHGRYTLNVKCRAVRNQEEKTTDVSFTVDLTDPEMKYVNDTSKLDLNPEFTCKDDRIRVNWLGSDEDSGIISYNYSVVTRGGDIVLDWSNDERSRPSQAGEWQFIKNLELENRTTYLVSVKAINLVGKASQVMSSDGVTVDPAKCEEIKDCVPGTPGCPVNFCSLAGDCPVGQSCEENADCISNYCNERSKKCATPACDDGLQNGLETEIDCGGGCDPCSIDAECYTDDDCSTGNCEFKVCVETDTCENGELDATEAGVDCGGACQPCETGEICREDVDCRLGFECDESEGLCVESESPGLLDRDQDGCPDEWETKNGFDANNPDDCQEDPDDDLLINFDEYKWATNPLLEDTDGDGFSDGLEVEKGTDPLDPNDFPKSRFALVLTIILISIVLIGVSGLLLYREYGWEGLNDKFRMILAKITGKRYAPRTSMPSHPAPRFYAPKPRIPTKKVPSKFLSNIKRLDKKRKELFRAFRTGFESKPEEKKAESKQRREEKSKMGEKKEKEEDIFEKLSRIGKNK